MTGSAQLPVITPEEQSKKAYGWDQVPAEKQKVIIDYAKKLRKKFPQMKEARLMRKVAEHFKINLV